MTEEEIDALQRMFRENNIEAPPNLGSLSFEQVTVFLRADRRDDLAQNLRTELDEGVCMNQGLQFVFTYKACSEYDTALVLS